MIKIRISALFTVFISLLLVPTLTLQSLDLYREETNTLQAGSAAPGAFRFGERTLNQGHLGYDKKTGQHLEEPTIHHSVFRFPEELTSELLSAEAKYVNQMMTGVDPTILRFRSGHTIHPQPGIDPSIQKTLPTRTSGGYYLVQFSYPFPTEERYRLESLGFKFYDCVEEAGLYARIPPGGLKTLQNTMAKGTIRYVGDIPNAAKVAPNLASQVDENPGTIFKVIVLTFEAVTSSQLEELGGLMIVDRRSDGPVNILEGRALGSEIFQLAQLDYVRWVEPQVKATSNNLEGGMGIGADVLKNYGYDGTGVQVMVVDTGIAQSMANYHPDLLSDRILDQYDYQHSDTVAYDTDGHGTHVTGTIAGRYNSGSSNSDPAWQGVAPGADLLIYQLCCGIEQYLTTWFQDSLIRATTGGRTAHISNNSWGIETRYYTTHSEIADRAVRGEYGGRPINVVAAAGDSSLGYGIDAPGRGKNVITVGSIKDGNWPVLSVDQCDGTYEYYWPPGEKVCTSKWDFIDNDWDMDDRVKPDLVAPGAVIKSATPWYLAAYGFNYYNYMEGTSMAAAHVSGAIAQLLDAYSDSAPWLFDWPMVVKAMLLASAVDIDEYLLAKTGRGMVDPYHAIHSDPGSAGMHYWGDSLDATFETAQFYFDVQSGYEEVVIVLSWADPAGHAEGQHELGFLTIQDGDGSVLSFDHRPDDTVQSARIPAGYTPGTWTVTVMAYSISSRQTFGLAAHTILASPNLEISGSIQPYPIPGYDYYYYDQYITNYGDTAAGSVAALSLPDGFTVQGVRIYTADGNSEYLDADELYHPTSSSFWEVAVGSTFANFDRHVRWLLEYDSSLFGGTYAFGNQALFRVGGITTGTLMNYTYFTIPVVFLPMVFR